MSNLMDTYDKMVKFAEEQESQAQLDKEAEALVRDRVEVISKYAQTANELLTEEYGEDYSEGDVVKLASYLIDHDIDEEENIEKVAEYIEAGQIMARSFVEELNSQSSDSSDESE